MRARRLVAALVGLLALLLAGCAPIPTGDGSGTGADSGAVGSGAVGIDPDAVIRYADTSGPSRFDPHRSSTGHDIRYFAPVYDRLVHLSPDGDPVPGLATRWEWEDDGLTLRMDLREGVTFHDGTAFDASAVAANIDRGKTVAGSTVVEDLAVIEVVEVVDEHTVRLRLNQRSSMLPGLLSHRAGAMISPAAFDSPDLDHTAVGTGFYRLVEYRPEDAAIYERNDEYWDDSLVGARRIEVDILPDEVTRMNALRTGEVDVAALNGRLAAEAAGVPGVTVHRAPTLTYLVLYLNRARSEFGDVRVRQALNLAVDRQAIVDGIYFGAAQPSVQPFPIGYSAYNPEYPADHYPHDPERARQLLAEAGLPDGFAFDMLVTARSPFTQVGEALQQMFREIGVTAQIRVVDPTHAADLYYGQEDGDGLVAQWGGRPDPSMTLELQFTADGYGNPGGHTTPRLEELHRRALDTVDPAAREALIQQATGETVEQAFQLPIAVDEAVYATTDRVVGFETFVTGQPDFRTLGLRR